MTCSSALALDFHLTSFENIMAPKPALQEDDVMLSSEAGAPFDEPNADVILRTSDNVDFRVFKAFLSFSSPFFRSMFDLPQVPEKIGDDETETKGGLPTIPVSEHSIVLRRLLLFCFPLDVEVYDDMEDIQSLLEVSIKYNVERAEKKAKEWLMLPRFVEAEPVRVFAIACRHGLREEALAAARFAWTRPILDENIGRELDHTTGTQFFQLLRYQKRCIQAARTAATDFVWIERTTFCWFQCPSCRGIVGTVGPDRAPWSYSSWWDSYMKRVADAFENCTWGQKMQDDLFNNIMTDTQNTCSACYLKVFDDMRVFSRLLQTQIEDTIRKVRSFVKIP